MRKCLLTEREDQMLLSITVIINHNVEREKHINGQLNDSLP